MFLSRHSWESTVRGYWWRYPNPRSSHVFSVDTLEVIIASHLPLFSLFLYTFDCITRFLATRRSVGSSFPFSISQVKQEGNILYTRRLVLKTNSLPSWGKHFFSDAKVAVIEECMVDRTKPSLIWYTRWSLYTGCFF